MNLSAGTVWYKMQPNSEIAAAIDDLLTDYCGGMKSHDVTVKPERIPALTAEILSRSDAVIYIGGMEAITPEDNIVFILSRTLGIPLEQGKRSRSKYIFDTLHGARLPSLKGSVLFPTRFGGPEGILLLSGEQTVIVLPQFKRAAITAAVSIRKFLAPYARQRRNGVSPSQEEASPPKEYGKFNRCTRRQTVTREYSADSLDAVMKRAVHYAQRKAQTADDADALYAEDFREQTEPYKAAQSNRQLGRWENARNMISLFLVMGIILALMIGAYLYPGGLF